MRGCVKILILLFAVCSLKTEAQDNSFSQFYANQLYLNPAFAGTTKGGRIGLNYRNQWPSVYSKFESYSIAADLYNPIFNGGFGLFAMSDLEGEGFLRTTRVGLIQSFERMIPKIVRFRAGYEVTAITKKVDWTKFVFSDNLDPILGNVNTSQVIAGADKRTFMDFTAGAMLDFAQIKAGDIKIGNTFGITMAHLMEPDESLLKTNTRLPKKTVIHYGMFIPLEDDPVNNRYLVLYPNIVFEKQANFQTANIGFFIAKNPLLAGIWYRSRKIGNFRESDALILNLGVRGDMGKRTIYKLGYSYDFTVSGLAANTAGAHEISMVFEFRDAAIFNGKKMKMKRRKAKSRISDCEDFGSHMLIF